MLDLKRIVEQHVMLRIFHEDGPQYKLELTLKVVRCIVCHVSFVGCLDLDLKRGQVVLRVDDLVLLWCIDSLSIVPEHSAASHKIVAAREHWVDLWHGPLQFRVA